MTSLNTAGKSGRNILKETPFEILLYIQKLTSRFNFLCYAEKSSRSSCWRKQKLVSQLSLLLWTKLHTHHLHCTALHCTALHCTALHCTALHYTALHCTSLHLQMDSCSLYAPVFSVQVNVATIINQPTNTKCLAIME